jgi:outer membrane lipoprotein SlyB
MDTTVTGMFPDQTAAALAAEGLVRAGFRTDQVRIVSAATRDRHQFIDGKTADAKRAVMLGLGMGAVGGAAAGALLTSVLGFGLTALAGGLAAAMGGAVLGLIVGRTTKSQVRDEIEHQVGAGNVLVSVITDEVRLASAMEVLAKEGGSSVVSTSATFTAAVLPTTPTSGS